MVLSEKWECRRYVKGVGPGHISFARIPALDGAQTVAPVLVGFPLRLDITGLHAPIMTHQGVQLAGRLSADMGSRRVRNDSRIAVWLAGVGSYEGEPANMTGRIVRIV